MNNNLEVIELTQENIESMIYIIRGQKVMLDFDLARIYDIQPKLLISKLKTTLKSFQMTLCSN